MQFLHLGLRDLEMLIVIQLVKKFCASVESKGTLLCL